jgi:hypothetical protein
MFDNHAKMEIVLRSKDRSAQGTEGKLATRKVSQRLLVVLAQFVSLLFQIVWPARWHPSHPEFHQCEIVILTVDGTMCPFHEVKTHPTKTRDPMYYSYKHGRAGLTYEVGMSIFEEKCVWINGPFPGGKTNDKGIFNSKLKSKIPEGKRVLGDSGYECKKDEVNIITVKRVQDSPAVRKFKRRALSRHEKFNSRLKTFACLNTVFRHSFHMHKSSFEAVTVICQYQMELGAPLFEGGV